MSESRQPPVMSAQLKKVIAEFYQTEKIFHDDMTLLMDTYATVQNGIVTLKDDSEFMKEGKKLTDSQKTTLKNILSFYPYLRNNPFGEFNPTDITSDKEYEAALHHIFDVLLPENKQFDAAMNHFQDAILLQYGIYQFTQSLKDENIYPSFKLIGNSLNVGDVLIKPMQRLLKYPLLLKELQKNVEPNTLEAHLAGIVLGKINERSEAINHAQSAFEAVNPKKAHYIHHLRAMQTKALDKAQFELTEKIKKLPATAAQNEMLQKLKNISQNLINYNDLKGSGTNKPETGIEWTGLVLEIIHELNTKSSLSEMENYLKNTQLPTASKGLKRHKGALTLENFLDELNTNLDPDREIRQRIDAISHIKNDKQRKERIQAELGLINIRIQEDEDCHRELQILFSDPKCSVDIRKDKHLLEQYQQLNQQAVSATSNSLISIDKNLHEQLDPYEFYFNQGAKPTPSRDKITRLFNQTAAFVVNDILSHTNNDERTLALEYWVRVANDCFNNPHLKDFNMGFAIHAGITNAAITALKKTNSRLSPEAKTILTTIDKMKENHFKNYREEIDNNPNAIPYSGILATDLTKRADNLSLQASNQLPLAARADAYISLEQLSNRIQNLKSQEISAPPTETLEQIILHTFIDDTSAYQLAKTLDSKAKESMLADSFMIYPEIKSTPATQNDVTPSQPLTTQEITPPEKTLFVVDISNRDIDQRKNNYVKIMNNIDGIEFVAREATTTNILNLDSKHILSPDRQQISIALNTSRTRYKKNPILLYTRIEYGKEMNEKDIPANLRDKVMDGVKRFDFNAYFEKATPAIINQTIAQLAAYKFKPDNLPDKDTFKVKLPKQVYVLDGTHDSGFAKRIFYNDRQFSIPGQTPFTVPAKAKAFAALYLMLTEPEFFRLPADESAANYYEIKNRLRLAERFITQLSPTDRAVFDQVLQQADPNQPEKRLLDALPESIQHYLEPSPELTLSPTEEIPENLSRVPTEVIPPESLSRVPTEVIPPDSLTEVIPNQGEPTEATNVTESKPSRVSYTIKPLSPNDSIRQKFQAYETDMTQHNEPHFLELQQLYADRTTRRLIKKTPELHQRFKDLYTRSANIMTTNLVLANKELYQTMEAEDYSAKPGSEKRKNLDALISRYNNLQYAIQYDILNRPTRRESLLAYEYWIRVARQSFTSPDYVDVTLITTIMTALAAAPVDRLNLSRFISKSARNDLLVIGHLQPKGDLSDITLLKNFAETNPAAIAILQSVNYLDHLTPDETVGFTDSSISMSYQVLQAEHDRIERNKMIDLSKTALAPSIEKTLFKSPYISSKTPNEIQKELYALSKTKGKNDNDISHETLLQQLKRQVTHKLPMIAKIIDRSSLYNEARPLPALEKKIPQTKPPIFIINKNQSTSFLPYKSLFKANTSIIDRPNLTAEEKATIITSQEEKYNPPSKQEANLDPNNKTKVFFLDDYARDIFKYQKQGDLNPFNESASMKLGATLYLMVTDPDFFKGPTPREAENKENLIKDFFKQLSPDEQKQFFDQYNTTPDPNNAEKTLLDVFPDKLKQYFGHVVYPEDYANPYTHSTSYTTPTGAPQPIEEKPLVEEASAAATTETEATTPTKPDTTIEETPTQPEEASGIEHETIDLDTSAASYPEGESESASEEEDIQDQEIRPLVNPHLEKSGFFANRASNKTHPTPSQRSSNVFHPEDLDALPDKPMSSFEELDQLLKDVGDVKETSPSPPSIASRLHTSTERLLESLGQLRDTIREKLPDNLTVKQGLFSKSSGSLKEEVNKVMTTESPTSKNPFRRI